MPKNTCMFFKQIEESLWRCSFCGETTTENPYDWVDENWKENLKPGWRIYSAPTHDRFAGPISADSLMSFKGESTLDVGFIYAPFVPEIPNDTGKDQQSKV